MRLIIITVILFPITWSFLWSRLTAVASLVDALAYLCALRARKMLEIPSLASSSSDGEEVLSFEELLEEASMDVQEAANSCSCGEPQQLMDAFDAIEGDCVVAAAAGIVAALLSCKCDRSRGLLLEALDVVAQLGDSPGEEEQLLRLWTAGVGSAGQEQSAAALAVCVDTGGLADEDLSLGSSGSLVSGRVQEAPRQGWVTCFVWTQGGRVIGRWARNWRVWQKKLALRLYLVPQNL